MGVHSLFSLVLLLIALFLVFRLWYPAPLDKAMGVGGIFWIILTIDLILGPLLTFAIFDLKKKELKKDLLIIIIIQMSAYCFGLYTVSQGRPVFQVFVVDDIELVRQVDLKYNSELQIDPEYQPDFFSPPRWVSAVYSTDPEISKQQKQDEIFGNSLASRPETYQAIQIRAEQIKAKVQNIDKLFDFNKQENVKKILNMHKNARIIGFLPVKALDEDMTVLIGGEGEPIAIVDLKPW